MPDEAKEVTAARELIAKAIEARKTQVTADTAASVEAEARASETATPPEPPPTPQEPPPDAPAAELPPTEPVTQPPPADADARIAALEAALAKQQHAYDVFQGRFHKEQEGSGTRIAELEGQLAASQQALEDAKQAMAQEPVKPEDLSAIFPKEVVDRYEPDLLNALNDGMTKKVTAATAKFHKELDAANQRVFAAELNARAPDWQAVDSNPAWKAWLNETDPKSGEPNGEFLIRAMKKRDAAHVAGLIAVFKSQATPGATRPPAGAPATPARPSVASQVTPARTTTQPPPPATPKTWTPQDVSALSQKIMSGNGSQQQQTAWRKDFDAAKAYVGRLKKPVPA